MIISAIIVTICFIAVTFEVYSMYKLFKSCCTVKCSVIASKKIKERRDGYLTDEYWKTDVTFTYNNIKKRATLKTSTYCQNGQILGCYYNPKKDIIFRKRDLKKQIKNSSIIITTIGFLFMVLNLIFTMSNSRTTVIKNITSTLSVILIITFLIIGIGYVAYAVNAVNRTSDNKVTKIKAKIIDVVRKSKRHNGNEKYTYYPIYSYTFNGETHETKSKLKRSEPPKKGSVVTIYVDNKKAGPVEYNDVLNSLIMGICFIVFASIFIYVFLFFKG